MRVSLPETYPSGVCLMVPIDRDLIPIVAGALERFNEQRSWEPDSYEAGYRAFQEVAAAMTTLCVDELIESNRQIYRLLDSTFNGRVYTADDSDPPVISPAIPVVPDTDYIEPGMLFRADQIVQLVDNTINGSDTPLYSYTPSVKELLQSIIDGIASGDTTSEGLLSQLELIAALLA